MVQEFCIKTGDEDDESDDDDDSEAKEIHFMEGKTYISFV